MNFKDLLNYSGDIVYIKSGLQGLDNCTGGFPRKAISIIAGGSGEGKSILAFRSAIRVAKNHDVLYLSLENNVATDKKRIDIELPEDRVNSFMYINKDDIPDDEKRNIFEIVKDYISLSIVTKMVDIIYIDSIDYFVDEIVPDGDAYSKSNAYKIIMRELRKLAKQFNLCIVATSQNNRDDSKKDISDMDQYCIEFKPVAQLAEVILVTKKKECKIVKNRNEALDWTWNTFSMRIDLFHINDDSAPWSNNLEAIKLTYDMIETRKKLKKGK